SPVRADGGRAVRAAGCAQGDAARLCGGHLRRPDGHAAGARGARAGAWTRLSGDAALSRRQGHRFGVRALLGLWPVTHAVLLLAPVVLILLPLVHDHALLMLSSLGVFAVLTLNMAVHEAHLVAIVLLAIVGGRHLREARGALEDIRARREERRRAA